MGVYAKGTALIINKKTGEAFKISREELVFESSEDVLNEKDKGQRHQAQIDHPVLGTLIWTIWEFPVGVERMKATNTNEHEVQKDFQYGLVPVKEPTDFATLVSRLDTKVPANESSKSKFVRPKPKAKAKPKAKTTAKSKVIAKKKPLSKTGQKKVTKPKKAKKAKKALKKKTAKRVTKPKKRVKKK